MKNQTLEMCLLLDFYGDMLTDKQKELFDLYYNEDLSLAEISENVGITRQGVRDSIVRAEHILRDMEEKLSLVRRYGRIEADLQRVTQLNQQIRLVNNGKYRDPHIADLTDEISKLLRNLSE